VVVIVVEMTTTSGEVAALLQAELKLLSGYPLNSVGVPTAALLVTATTELGLAVVIVVYSVMVDTSVSVETIVSVEILTSVAIFVCIVVSESV
jgi:hypothetical protein